MIATSSAAMTEASCSAMTDESWGGASAGSNRLNRGGSWNNNSDNYAVSYCSYDSPRFRGYYLGFRVVRQAN